MKNGLIVDNDGTKYWFLNGQHHRTNGPAIEYANGDKEWLFNNKRHRIDGPAVEYANGGKEYWILGIRINSFYLKKFLEKGE
jgi:hypothetical protein